MVRRVLVFVAMCAAAAGGALGIAAGCQGAPAAAPTDASVTTILLPGATPADLRFSPLLSSVLVPGGASGKVFLIDDRTLAVTSVGGFASPTSVDEASGNLLVADLAALQIVVASPSDGHVLASAALHGPPALVRSFVLTSEVWVTEPSVQRIEVFGVAPTTPPTIALRATIATPSQSLVADATRARAYTNVGGAMTASLDAFLHTTVESWPSGCAGAAASANGLALDEQGGILVVACDDGTITLLDVSNHGATLGTFADNAGVVAIDYNALLGHLYVAFGQGGVDIAERSFDGGLAPVDRLPSGAQPACVVADRGGNAFVCDPAGGKVVAIPDLHGGVDF